MVDDAGGGLEVSIKRNIKNDTSLDACKFPPTLEVGKMRLQKAVLQVIILVVNLRIIMQHI